MLPQHATASQPPAAPIAIGVGIDMSRYGHYAAFLREAALDLLRTFHLEPVPTRGTEKRHG